MQPYPSLSLCSIFSLGIKPRGKLQTAARVKGLDLIDAGETIVATAIPRITDEFHSLDEVGWYGSAFFVTLASFQSTWGKLYKYFPLKTVFIAAAAAFELGSLACGKHKNVYR